MIAAILLFARDEIKIGRMTIGLFGVFVYALFKAYEPVKRIGSTYQLFLQAAGTSAQVFAFLDLPDVGLDEPGAKVLPRFARSIEFEEVSFAYDRGTTILRDVDLSVPAGAVVAIVGSSGAGKTTLVNLLPRFHVATHGCLRVDGCDVRGVTLRSLREQMAIVTQETILFNDTIWNNLCYGRPDLPEEKVWPRPRQLWRMTLFLRCPRGIRRSSATAASASRVASGSASLSRAQRAAEGRPILILDEATSELDSESEMLVQDALNNLMTGRTVFVIAHRLSTIRRADTIAVIDGGAIRERGTHEELLARGGVYARLYEMQFRDTEPVSRGANPPKRAYERFFTEPGERFRCSFREVRAWTPALHDRLRPGPGR